MKHGERYTYTFHKCRCEPCTEASTRYERRRRYYAHIGQPYTVPAVGFQRRARALMAIGYTMAQIAEGAGLTPTNLSVKLSRNAGSTVTRATHERMAALYERLHMHPQSGVWADRNRRWAESRGWAPPLAWDDIDNDPAPTGLRVGDVRNTRRVTKAHEGQRPCARCGVTRQINHGRGDYCHDCRLILSSDTAA